MLKDRGLILRDEVEALRQLKIISYFRLANYMRPMEADKTTHIFKPNRFFENAVDLYYFDKQLRVCCLLLSKVLRLHYTQRSYTIFR